MFSPFLRLSRHSIPKIISQRKGSVIRFSRASFSSFSAALRPTPSRLRCVRNSFPAPMNKSVPALILNQKARHEQFDVDPQDDEETAILKHSIRRYLKEGPEGWDGNFRSFPWQNVVLQVFPVDIRINRVPMNHRHIGYAVEEYLWSRPDRSIALSPAVIMSALSDDIKGLLAEEELSLKRFAELYPSIFYLLLNTDGKSFSIMLSEELHSQVKRIGGANILKQVFVWKKDTKVSIPAVNVEVLHKSKGSMCALRTFFDRTFHDSYRPFINSHSEFASLIRLPLVKILRLSDEEAMVGLTSALGLTLRLKEMRPLLSVVQAAERYRGMIASTATTKLGMRDYYKNNDQFMGIINSLEQILQTDKETIYLYAVPKTWRQHAMKGFEAFDVAMTKWRLAMAEYNKNPVGPAPKPNITGPRPPPSRIPILEGMDVVDALKNLTINPASFHIYASIHPSYSYLEDKDVKLDSETFALDVSGNPVTATPMIDPATRQALIPLVEPYDHHRVARHLPVTSFMPIGELIGRAGHVTQQLMLHVLLSAPHYFRFEKDESACGSGPKYNEKGELQPNFKYLKSVQFIVHHSYCPFELQPGSLETPQSVNDRMQRLLAKVYSLKTSKRGAFKLEITRLHMVRHAMNHGLSPLIDIDVLAMAVYDHLYEKVGTRRLELKNELRAAVPEEFSVRGFVLSPTFYLAFPLLFRGYELPPNFFVECVDSTTFGKQRDDVPEDSIQTEEQLIDVVKEIVCECSIYSAMKGNPDPFVSHVLGKSHRFVQAKIKKKYGHFYNFFLGLPEHFELIKDPDAPQTLGAIDTYRVRVK